MRLSQAPIVLLLLLFSCSPVRYPTVYEGGRDPLYDLKPGQTIGFTPFYWTEAARVFGCDELAEKQLYSYAKKELERRGFKVLYISPEFLEEDRVLGAVYVKSTYASMPDLTLTASYWQGFGDTVRASGPSFGSLSWSNKSGGGYYGNSEGYDAETCTLYLSYVLWSGKPKYIQKVWEGTIKKGSSKMDLFEQAEELTSQIFGRKFSQ